MKFIGNWSKNEARYVCFAQLDTLRNFKIAWRILVNARMCANFETACADCAKGLTHVDIACGHCTLYSIVCQILSASSNRFIHDSFEDGYSRLT